MSANFDIRNPQHREMYLMESVDGQYMGLVKAIRETGTVEGDSQRSEDTWRSLIGCVTQLRNTTLAFPALLSKQVAWLPAVRETCWFMRGETNIKTLDSKIWDEWADVEGECGPIYGEMWRHWPDNKIFYSSNTMDELQVSEAYRQRIDREKQRMLAAGAHVTELPDGRELFELEIDQLLDALLAICSHSRSRRILVNAFNPGYIHMQGLPPCHVMFDFNVTKATRYDELAAAAAGREVYGDTLHLTATMRSQDVLLGRPFNIIGYTTLLHLFAKYARLNIGTMTLNTSNTHVYEHHWDALKQQQRQYEELIAEMEQSGQPMQYPTLRISDDIFKFSPKELLDNITADYFQLEGYQPKAPVRGRVTV
ncbi:putative thymidylate synthase [Erwinia phage vB_EamM_Yoloswag]|uniref:Thymidylate synthase n=1 Tax=Erwinia phage vB_EamM_Yoloswag TaxID=1958956 RepID=A0A1S6L2X9_9CAUD|nr:putative thymidylate synthase [Erwinia phage vB_EamM_Yoloswag]AQT28523.1 putative thymidylate synthase [Erwinia phage vB_EamM_Yoloswag]